MQEVVNGSLKLDPSTGDAIMPKRTVDLLDSFRAALETDTVGLQRVPIVNTKEDGSPSRPWFLCDCGRRCLVLYRPKNAERYACPKCSSIGYKPPSSGDLAHKQYVRNLIAERGIEEVNRMAREGLQRRLDAACAKDRSRNG